MGTGNEHSTQDFFMDAANSAADLYGEDSCIFALVLKEHSKFHSDLGNTELAGKLLARANWIFASRGVSF